MQGRLCDKKRLNNLNYCNYDFSILTLNGQDWKDRRVKLSPIFTSGKMKMMFDILDGISDKFVRTIVQEISNIDELEMRSWTQRLTIDNIGNVAFGIEPNCKKVNAK